MGTRQWDEKYLSDNPCGDQLCQGCAVCVGVFAMEELAGEEEPAQLEEVRR